MPTLRSSSAFAATWLACAAFSTAGFITTSAQPASAQPAEAQPDVYSQLDANFAAAVVIPNLRRLNGDLEAMLESMERQDLLFAGRPLDQVKAFLGVSIGVDDFRGAAVIWGAASDGDGLGPAVFAAPTKDADAFIEANFTPLPDVGPNAVRASNGGVLHYAIVDGDGGPYVRFCTDPETLDATTPDPAAWPNWRASLPASADEAIAKGEVVVAAQNPARLAVDLDATLFADLPAVVRTMLLRLGEREDDGLIAVDFDALALVLRGVGTFEDDWLACDPREDNRSVAMDRLAGGAFYAAGVAQTSRFDRTPAFREAFMWLGVGGPPAWASSVDRISAAAYVPERSPGRVGLLSQSVVRFTTDDPAAVERVMRDPDQPRRFRIADVPPEMQPYAPMLALVLGASEGVLHANRTAPDEVSLAFRPDAPVAAGPSGATLVDDPVLRAMRAWLPAPRDAEAFVRAGPVLSWVRAIAARAPMLPPDLVIPEVNQLAPALAAGARIESGEVTWTVILPSDVLKGVVNALVAQH